MSKISNYEVALRLSKITNRPLEDFYEAPTQQVEAINNQQAEEESVEVEETDDSDSFDKDIQEDEGDSDVRIRNVHVRIPRVPTEDDAKLIQIYGGRVSDNGKLICGRDITRKEYLALIKDMTQQDVLNSPLLYTLFRAEGQTEGHFWSWLERFPKEV